MNFRLIHLSDLHLSPLSKLKMGDYFTKRIVGCINWHYSRKHHHQRQVLDCLLEDIEEQQPDHIVITGDITNLGLAGEIENAHRLFQNIGTAENISIVPGNHDAYLSRSIKIYQQCWKEYFSTDEITKQKTPFPYVRDRGPFRIIGLSSAIATLPFFSGGRVDSQQQNILKEIITKAQGTKLFPVVLLHHPPDGESYRFPKRLWQSEKFQNVLETLNQGLVLHGHIHHRRHVQMNENIHYLSAPSASYVNAEGKGAGYNIVDYIERDGEKHISLKERDIVDLKRKVFEENIRAKIII